ncbi:hypothetical protein PC118_g7603 [Phytophthora cactorum]|uniref:IQ motif, EF-hand binding site n=1 Tax=Phytophthora cactorum TaxID=29920 RepID=A0A8T1G678_9STRA|nr:hypothetical protein PC118_g7603 [Phytophthora cactorum]
MAQLTPTRRQRSSQLAKDVETTRLPYLIDAGLRLRDSQHHVEPGAWTAPIVAEERHDGEQNPSGNRPFVHTQDKKLKLKRAKKQVARLHPRLKRSNSREDEPGGYVPKLPELDERVLILYHSSLKRAWKQQQKQIEVDTPTPSLTHYGHEAIYAATQIQKIVRGIVARKAWRAFYCLRNQSAAARIQFAFRRAVVCRKVLARLAKKRNDRATQIQAWYRGHRCRDLLLYQHIRVMNQRIANFQKYIRGRRLWAIVMAILYKRRCNVATEIQRCYRGWKGRQRAVAIRFEQSRYLYRRLTLWVLHAMGEDIETSMAFLKRAKEIGITNEELSECETHFFQPAHLLRPNDAQAFLDLAILCQSRDQLPRAEANYAKALAQLPQEYAIPGYLHRINMVDRLLLNYHRFCSIFNFRQVNVLLKEVFTAKKGKKLSALLCCQKAKMKTRGVIISGHRVMLIIEKCGLSFRLDGHDLESCVTYNGFFSHSSSTNLLCYLNWIYAETLCGREFTRKGDKIFIRSVSSVNRLTAECFVLCVGSTLTDFIVPLADCIQAINLRNLSAGDKETPELPLPMTVDDTARLVEAMAERVILVPALRMATQDLKVKASAGFTISVQPPPKMHFIYQRKSSGGSTRTHANTTSPPTLQFVYPVTDGLRGVSIGTKHFRKKCTRHAVQFTRCRCMLPIISTSAHIEAISRALAPPSTSSES